VGVLFIDVTLRDIDLHNAHLGICLRVTIKFEFAFSYLYCVFNWMFGRGQTVCVLAICMSI